ncbi:MAG TPA: hypothetical protein VIO14_00325 [Dehalococcoidia bacterium]
MRRGDQPWERDGARIEERDPAGRAGFIYAAPARGWREYGMVLRRDGTAVHVYVVPHTDADGRDNRNPLNSAEALRAMAALTPIPPQP